MAQPKKPPVRHCTGCGAEAPKGELIRIVRSPEGEITIDEKGKSSGRGAYLCRKASCLQKAKRTGRLSRALNAQIPDEIYAQLSEKLERADG
ncbi:MAG: YlxR family protein [Clostridia bacterium]|nr:YlxR family protein [Clostridia bacterium]